jgi:hypothetical protein
MARNCLVGIENVTQGDSGESLWGRSSGLLLYDKVNRDAFRPRLSTLDRWYGRPKHSVHSLDMWLSRCLQMIVATKQGSTYRDQGEIVPSHVQCTVLRGL